MNLRFEVEDSVYKAGKKAGTILMQNPGAGHKIKSGRLIYLTMVSSVPRPGRGSQADRYLIPTGKSTA